MSDSPRPERTVALPLRGLGDLTPLLARIHGNARALITDTRTLTFRELDAESTAIAAGLRARGVSPGDRVSLLAQNRWEWIVTYHAVLKAGAVVNPLNVMLTGEEVSYVLRDAGSTALVTSADRWASIAEHLRDVPSLRVVAVLDAEAGGLTTPPGTGFTVGHFDDLRDAKADGFAPAEVDPDALACIAYTSGTTGHPKGAMQSQRSLVLNTSYTATMHRKTQDDVVVTALPAAHVYGNVAITGTLLAGGTVVLMSRFDAARTLDLIDEHSATMFEGVPAMYAMLVADPGFTDASLGSLVRCTVGGQTMAPSVEERWEQRTGAPLLQLWGMTEISGLGTTHAALAPNERGSIGVSLPGVEVRVADLDDATRTVAAGETGELLVRGPIVMMGYFGNPEATAEAIEPDGWLHTGDVAVQDGLGHVFVVDRLKDMIVTGGYNIYPAELERVLIEHDAVALVAVGRVPDDVKGEVAHAYVVRVSGSAATADDIREYARTRLAPYKVPRAVHFVDALPTTSSGKIMRRMLTPPVEA